MIAVGLTGGIGSGKSAVAKLLERHGARIVDADVIAREVVAPGGPAYDAVVARFGADVLRPDGTLDRGALAARAFGDPAALADLNAITHPVIGLAMAEQLEELARARDGGGAAPGGPGRAHSGVVAVVVIPLLRREHVEGLGLRAVVVVDCPVDVAVARLVDTRQMRADDAQARVAAQPSREERLALADAVVDNSGTETELAERVEALWRWIGELAPAGS